jgi:hypothetical protein
LSWTRITLRGQAIGPDSDTLTSFYAAQNGLSSSLYQPKRSFVSGRHHATLFFFLLFDKRSNNNNNTRTTYVGHIILVLIFSHDRAERRSQNCAAERATATGLESRRKKTCSPRACRRAEAEWGFGTFAFQHSCKDQETCRCPSFLF